MPDQKDFCLEEGKTAPGPGSSSLLDVSESPTSKLLLPSPMKPVAPSSCTDQLYEENSSTVHHPVIDEDQDIPGPKTSQASVSASSSEYQGFTAQGWKIQSIPCDTGTSDLKSSQTKRSKDEITSAR